MTAETIEDLLPARSSDGAGSTSVVEAMRQPSFYREPPEEVEVRETHISWVFLAGERAYKLKKPVKLPFVDYSTLESRRRFCHEEVALNRRLAPDAYLGTRAIAPSSDGPRLADEDAEGAVDYVVEMRRLPADRTVAAMAARGELHSQHVYEIGRRLAAFHERAERAPAEAATLEATAAIDDTFRTLSGFAGAGVDAADVLAAKRFSDAFLAAHRRRLLERERAGLVRDGHGDLRADHVFLLDGTVEMIDCLEFDPALRRIDTAADIAFLVMELDGVGAERLAEHLVDAYRAAGGDPGERDLLSFYAAQRAWMRCKVALLRSAQLAPDAPERARSLSDAARLMGLGRRLAWQARLPLLVVVCGPPASGKTYLARALAAASGLPRVSSDETRKRLAGVGPTEPAGPAAYTDDFTARTYRELGRLAVHAWGSRGGAIVDATLRRAADRAALMRRLGEGAERAVFVECRAPRRVLDERAHRRDLQAEHESDAGPEVAERLRLEFEPLDEVAPAAHVPLRTDRPVDELVRDLEALLDRRLAR